MALAVIAALSDVSITIPESIAVIGCDDILLAQFSIPSLTTIGFNNQQFLDLLIASIVAASRGESVKKVLLPALSVVVRVSA